MHGHRKLDGPRYDRARRLDYATGCALWVKRPVLESVGGFDERFVNYMEDYDFAYRVRAAGYQIGYVPGARVYHKVAQTLGVQSAERWRYLGRNTVLFYRLEERFPIWKLWSFLSWVTLRETLKGQAAYLPHYWQGVREGVSQLAEWEENGNRRL
jgi:GT2 family glycosyltransferase